MAVTLSKVELILNTLSSGYHVAWVDTDVVHFANVLPYLLTLDTDIALSNENCHVNSNFNPMHWNRSEEFNQNTGAAFRACSSWLSSHFGTPGPPVSVCQRQQGPCPAPCTLSLLPSLVHVHGPCAASRPSCLWSCR